MRILIMSFLEEALILGSDKKGDTVLYWDRSRGAFLPYLLE
jgi:hypothetical protein